MTANDDDAVKPDPATATAMRSAAVVGLDETATETITLLLAILGWSVVTVKEIATLPDKPQQLIFINELLFINRLIGSKLESVSCGTIVLVGLPSSARPFGIKGVRNIRAEWPLDVAQLETIIAGAVE